MSERTPGELQGSSPPPVLPDRATTITSRLELKERLLVCEGCDLFKVGNGPVPFSGPTPAEWAIVGEAPGKNEDKVGAPFVGQAGALMRMYLEEVGLNAEDAFICNTVSCFPDRTPRTSEVHACKQNKIDQLELGGARYVLVMGGVALSGFRPDLQITKAHGRPFEQGEGTVYLPTYHPAGALRKREWEMDMAREIGMFAQLLKAVRENPDAWTGFVPDTCVICDKEIEAMADEGVRYDPEGITYCAGCYPHSPYGRKVA